MGKKLGLWECHSTPYGLCYDQNDKVYIAEGFHTNPDHQIEIFSLEQQKIIKEFGKRGSEARQLHCPQDVTINGKLVYITDEQNHRIQEIGRAVQQECRDRSRMPSSA
eukprot:TRINITY_DN2691_c0_g1_i1.p1 TRINITY_DN2691_c0_g1~~TRINITY_DN2691_c0_g1_i1.p1  ORF type:complete len:108 (+),score=19.04 TRINITY_DN2691_c0_g1_i1:30-353(+)